MIFPRKEIISIIFESRDENDCFNKALPFFIKAESLNSNDRAVLTALKEIYTLQG